MVILKAIELTIESIFPFCFSDGQDSDAIQPEAEITVLTVEGGRADLPCDITAKNKDDSVYLVLWYRKTGTPIYR